jgi:hypothetical protein
MTTNYNYNYNYNNKTKQNKTKQNKTKQNKKTEDRLFMMLLYRAMGPLSVCTASTIHGRTTTNQTTATAHLKETLKGKKRFVGSKESRKGLPAQNDIEESSGDHWPEVVIDTPKVVHQLQGVFNALFCDRFCMLIESCEGSGRLQATEFRPEGEDISVVGHHVGKNVV